MNERRTSEHRSNERRTPDQRTPWFANIHQLVRRPGEMVDWRRGLPAPVGVGNELIGVPEASEIEVDLRLESVSEGVLATGRMTADIAGECARCLGPITDRSSFDVQELFFYPGRDADEDALFILDDTIDLEQPMRDAIVPELPFMPLCRPDCLGLCPQCGFPLNDDPSHTHEAPIDPRWAGLEGLARPETTD